MYIKDINSLNNINFNSKLKTNKKIKNNSNNKITAPVIMGILTAQMLKEQTLNSNFEAQQQKGYLNKQLTKEEENRGQKLADCFNFYKNQGEVIFNIMTILTKSERNINDNFFIKKFFEFIESDFPHKTKICLFEILSEPKDNELLQTALTNFTTYASDSDNIEARFTIADLYTLKDIYSRSKNKELILDMIKEGIVVDEESELKAYRFETNEILNLNKCYIDTPNKDLFLTLIN